MSAWFKSFHEKGCTHQTLSERGAEVFADGDVHVLRQIHSRLKSAAIVVVPGLLQTIQICFLFFLERIADERDCSKVGYDHVPPFETSREGVPRRR